MTLTGILILLLIAGIVGGLGQAISGYSFGGCLMSIIVGFIGAYVGIWLAGQLGLPEIFTVNIEGESFPVVWGVIGSAILSLLLGLLTRRRVY
ncbi:MAG: GlsB/YeaQ/YmgE family stress response membrane protein [Chloroflexota bacterium]|nr:GlsB/YeaQ/YmgE family stress response membrane protein [Chloroflexota bacterium]